MPDDPALSYYEDHAASLADSYETLSLETAHPALLSVIETKFANRILSVLDVGAGTGRDAAWLAARGHRVIAVEPSPAMRRIGESLHSAPEIDWRSDRLPELGKITASGQTFDLIVVSAVWMHVEHEDRQNALEVLSSLLNPAGALYLTLRLGPAEPARGIFKVSVDEITSLAQTLGLTARKLNTQTDLLGRPQIRWVSMLVTAN